MANDLEYQPPATDPASLKAALAKGGFDARSPFSQCQNVDQCTGDLPKPNVGTSTPSAGAAPKK